jgi:hypothetical protein
MVDQIGGFKQLLLKLGLSCPVTLYFHQLGAAVSVVDQKIADVRTDLDVVHEQRETDLWFPLEDAVVASGVFLQVQLIRELSFALGVIQSAVVVGEFV